MQAPAEGSAQQGEGGTPRHEYLTVATQEGHEPSLVRPAACSAAEPTSSSTKHVGDCNKTGTSG